MHGCSVYKSQLLEELGEVGHHLVTRLQSIGTALILVLRVEALVERQRQVGQLVLQEGLLPLESFSAVVDAVSELVGVAALAKACLEEALHFGGVDAVQGVDLRGEFAQHGLNDAFLNAHCINFLVVVNKFGFEVHAHTTRNSSQLCRLVGRRSRCASSCGQVGQLVLQLSHVELLDHLVGAVREVHHHGWHDLLLYARMLISHSVHPTELKHRRTQLFSQLLVAFEQLDAVWAQAFLSIEEHCSVAAWLSNELLDGEPNQLLDRSSHLLRDGI